MGRSARWVSGCRRSRNSLAGGAGLVQVLAVEKTMEVKGLEPGYEYFFGVAPDDDSVEIFYAFWRTRGNWVYYPGWGDECFYRRRSSASPSLAVSGLDGGYDYGYGVPPAESELFYGFEWSTKAYTKELLKRNTIAVITTNLIGFYRIARSGGAGLN